LTTQDEKNFSRLVTAFIATAVMLTLALPPIGWWPLAWLAYVPFILACSQEYKPFKLCLAAYIAGAGFWLGNIYWMCFVTVAGWLAFCLYTALLWPILAMSLRWCRTKKIPLVIAAPILIVGIEHTQGFLLGGFYWDHLSHSQYANTTLTQIADIFGAAGVSFLVAMVNGAIAEITITVVRRASRVVGQNLTIRNTQYSILTVVITVAAVAGALIYGKWRINQTDKFVTMGPVIAAVQTNVPQSVKQSFEAEEQILDEVLKQSRQCIKAGTKLPRNNGAGDTRAAGASAVRRIARV
jgi:apolipoprotein N-acyltransferase